MMWRVITWWMCCLWIVTSPSISTVEELDVCTLEDQLGARYERCHDKLTLDHSRRHYDDFLTAPNERALNMICSCYQAWVLCLQSVAAQCDDQIDRILDLSSHVRRRTSDICIQEREGIINNIDCLLTQRQDHNYLFRGCYKLMQLRLEAHMYNRCSVVVEYVRCEDTLVRSACGSIAADFRLSLTLETKFVELSQSNRCLYTPAKTSAGNTAYAYSLACPPEFPLVVRNCYLNFQRSRIVMHRKLLSVIKSPRQDFHRYCNAYHSYTDCVAPVLASCPEGVQQLYEAVPEWKHSVSVARYMCGVYTEYIKSWNCYQRLVHLEFPRWCKQLFDEHPTQIHAYIIKCTQDDDNSVKRLRRRGQLIDCYDSFVENRCGRNASATMARLIHLQYSFDYLPSCFSQETQDCACPAQMSSANHVGVSQHHITVYAICIVFLLHVNNSYNISHL